MVICCSIIQEVKGLTKKLYSAVGRPVTVSLQYFTAHIVYLFLRGCGLHYNTRNKKVNEEIILCYTVQEEDQNFRFIVHIVYLF